MRKGHHGFSSFFLLGILVGALSCGTSLLSAQDTPASTPQQPQSQPSQAPDQSGQTPSEATPTQSSPSQSSPSQSAPSQAAPDQSAPPQQSPDAQAQPTSGDQTFTGTVVKAGDKYVLQDAASGTTYDIDHQDQVSKFEGKKVRVHGTLDASGKMIHVQ